MNIRRSVSAHLSSTVIIKKVANLSILFTVAFGLIFALTDIHQAFADEVAGEPEITPLIEANFVIKPFRVNQSISQIKIIYVKQSEETTVHYTTKETVEEVLAEADIKYVSDDLIQPSLQDTVVTGASIVVKKITYEQVEKVEQIPFVTAYQDDPTQYVGVTKELQAGVEGQKLNRYQLTYQDGHLIDNILISSEIVAAPINRIILRGTKPIVVGEFNCAKWDSIVDSKTSNYTENSWLKFIMRCESACNSAIKSKYGPYYGLFQFSKSTYASYGGTDIYDGEEQITIALNIYRLGGAAHHWKQCNAEYLNQ